MSNRTVDYVSEDDWHAEARRLFGDDKMKWKFVCPSCGHVASVQDWKDAGAGEGEVAFSCVGRHLDNPHHAFQQGKQPCNYAGGGLIRLNPVVVQDGDERHNVFAFAKDAKQPDGIEPEKEN